MIRFMFDRKIADESLQPIFHVSHLQKHHLKLLKKNVAAYKTRTIISPQLFSGVTFFSIISKEELKCLSSS